MPPGLPHKWVIILEFGKSVITFGIALLAITVTFSDSILKASPSKVTRWLLGGAWTCLLIVVLSALFATMNASATIGYMGDLNDLGAAPAPTASGYPTYMTTSTSLKADIESGGVWAKRGANGVYAFTLLAAIGIAACGVIRLCTPDTLGVAAVMTLALDGIDKSRNRSAIPPEPTDIDKVRLDELKWRDTDKKYELLFTRVPVPATPTTGEPKGWRVIVDADKQVHTTRLFY